MYFPVFTLYHRKHILWLRRPKQNKVYNIHIRNMWKLPKERKADFRDQVWRCKASSEPSSSPTSIFLPGLLFPKAAILVTSLYRASFLPCVPSMEKGFLPSVMTLSLQNRILIGPVWVTHPLWCSKPWLLHWLATTCDFGQAELLLICSVSSSITWGQ